MLSKDHVAGVEIAPWTAPPGWAVRATAEVSDADGTDRIARGLADATEVGDTILLSGDLGAGKTHLARAFIRHALGDAGADVPSPSFTLVQTYETPRGEIWHADLYRLGGAGEIVELGLDLAMDEARCLVEWPERMAPDWPGAAVLIRMEMGPGDADTARHLALYAPQSSALGDRLERVFSGSEGVSR